MTYFGPIPKSSIDQDKVMQYVQRNAHTFYQQLTLRGVSITNLSASGIAQFADGSASAPSITFSATGQQDVGIFRGGTDEIAFTVGGTEVATFEATGLELNMLGSGAAPTIYYAADSTTGIFWAPGSTAGIGFSVSGTERTRVTSTGLRGLVYAHDLENQDVNGFTNTSYADLDALTTAAFANPVAVTLTTGTEALVMISVARSQQVTSGTHFVSYRVSGATTIAANDDFSTRNNDTTVTTKTFQHVVTLTPGSNTFEMQARTTANSANLSNPSITVIALNV